MVEKGLLKDVNQQMLLVSDNIDDLLDQMKNYAPPTENGLIKTKFKVLFLN